MYRYFTDLDFRWAIQGGSKMLSIWVDSIESTQIVSSIVDSSCRKSICMYRYFTDLDFRWAIQGGWKCCQFDRIDTNHFSCCRFVMPEVDLRDTTPCESSWDVTCKSSRIVKCLRRIDSVWVYWTWMRLPNAKRVDFALRWSCAMSLVLAIIMCVIDMTDCARSGKIEDQEGSKFYLGYPNKMFPFPSPSLSWRWVGRLGKKKGMNTWRVLSASEGRAAWTRGPFVHDQMV